ncbi:MAG: protein-L-isoaspartate(D-aspartate) O-methyltransferase [Candidatus Krumholzibacteriia bacterium]
MNRDPATQRRRMVEHQIAGRGIRDARLLEAMRTVPREAFVPPELRDYAYEDGPLPIGSDQTISQPYIVAAMIDALDLEPEDRVLEIGAGSGYAAAVMSRMVAEVVAVERHAELADAARRRLTDLGYDNVSIVHGDGTRGFPERAPFDAITVAAAGPRIPASLREQLAVGGRLVIPVGPNAYEQQLVRVTRVSVERYEESTLAPVRFVPLIGAEGWSDAGSADVGRPAAPHGSAAAPRAQEPGMAPPAAIGPAAGAPEVIGRHAQTFTGLDLDTDAFLERVADARVVLLGEATHGTSEFYRLRARLTRALVERAGFGMVAVEADWPDAARIDHWVRDLASPPADWQAFARFPTWMWRNQEVREFVDWLRHHNAGLSPAERVGFHGLDLYSLYTSMDAVLRYLDEVDPEAASVARRRYECLEPWERDPAAYGRAALTKGYRECEQKVLATLGDLLENRLRYIGQDGHRYLDAMQNARLVSNAERYYRVMYYGSRESWNLRDSHMFETLQALRSFHGAGSRAVVWEHNSHVGNARATEMGARGEHNVGQLCRDEYGDGAYLVGFGTDRGTVAAATDWGGPMEIKRVRPALPDSYEAACRDSGAERFALPLRGGAAADEVRRALSDPRLERAIGVIYRPESELASHYFQAVLPEQFDEWIFVAETEAVRPLATVDLAGVPDTYPFGV